jgi:hypothetical protein
MKRSSLRDSPMTFILAGHRPLALAWTRQVPPDIRRWRSAAKVGGLASLPTIGDSAASTRGVVGDRVSSASVFARQTLGGPIGISDPQALGDHHPYLTHAIRGVEDPLASSSATRGASRAARPLTVQRGPVLLEPVRADRPR